MKWIQFFGFIVHLVIPGNSRYLKCLNQFNLRRLVVSTCASTMFSLNAAFAVTSQNTFTSEQYHTSLNYRATWEKMNGNLSGNRDLTAFVDPSDPDTSISITFTPIPADYNRLSSFGGIETLRQYVLPRGEGVSTKIVSEVISGNAYTLEYVVSAPDAPPRHVQSVFALRPQEAIVGVVVQTKEDTYGSNKEMLQSILPSLKLE